MLRIREILTKYSGESALKQYLEVRAAEQRDEIATMEKQLEKY